MAVRTLLGGLLVSLGALLVLLSFAVAYCYMTGQSYPLLPEIGEEFDLLSMIEAQVPGLELSRYVAGDVRVLVNAGLLALGLLIIQGIGYVLMSLGGRELASRS